MTSAEIPFIRKRDGRLVAFDQGKITEAINKAVQAVGEADPHVSEQVTRQVVTVLKILTKDNVISTVEQVQDLVEQMLIQDGYGEVGHSSWEFVRGMTPSLDIYSMGDEAVYDSNRYKDV